MSETNREQWRNSHEHSIFFYEEVKSETFTYFRLNMNYDMKHQKKNDMRSL